MNIHEWMNSKILSRDLYTYPFHEFLPWKSHNGYYMYVFEKKITEDNRKLIHILYYREKVNTIDNNIPHAEYYLHSTNIIKPASLHQYTVDWDNQI